jgi:hypothetical protein
MPDVRDDLRELDRLKRLELISPWDYFPMQVLLMVRDTVRSSDMTMDEFANAEVRELYRRLVQKSLDRAP